MKAGDVEWSNVELDGVWVTKWIIQPAIHYPLKPPIDQPHWGTEPWPLQSTLNNEGITELHPYIQRG